MLKPRASVWAAMFAVVVSAGAAEYDFFDLSRYPEGGRLKPGVELYEVREEGASPANAYTRRVVRWHPRKGVDTVKVEEGMILRDWTLKADVFDERVPPDLQWETFRHEALDMPVNVGDDYVRRLRGYLHPPADGNYTFKLSADDLGVFFLSTDESPANIRMISNCWAPAGRRDWTRREGQVSEPVPLKQGRKYFYEILHHEHGANDHLTLAWGADGLDEEIVGGAHLSSLDGETGVVIEQRAPMNRNVSLDVRPHGEPRTFRAHLMGFDGIGNEIGDPFQGEDFFEPSVILRMDDGRKQTFRSKSFVQEDREFILGVYVAEMQRVMSGLDKTEYSVQPKTLREYPGDAQIGEPGTLLLQSAHFVVPSGSQAAGPNSRWLNDEQPDVAARCRESVFNMFENMHAYLEHGGHLMPYWDREEQYKYEVHVGGTISNGFQRKGGGAGGGYGAQGMGWLGSTPGGFGHEYGHGMSIQWQVGDGEILAQVMMELTDNRMTSFEHNVNRPWRNSVHAEYNSCLFYRNFGFDPNWGMLAVTAIPASVEEPVLFQTLARLGEQRGMFKDGIRGLGDMVGDYSARLPEFDTQNQQPMRKAYFAAFRNYLEPLDPERGIWRIPWDEAPEPFGANIIRLLPEPGADVITVDFQGLHDPAVYSDWRACIVAVGADGRARYSDLWSQGRMTMERREGDRRYWLTVAATPRALLYGGRGARYRQVYEGRHAPRYPWQVAFEGAVPGTPHRRRSDLDDMHFTYGGIWLSRLVPDTPDTEEGTQFLEGARAYIERLSGRLAEADLPEKLYHGRIIRTALSALEVVGGAPHPNGGGWMASTAEVAPTAYVGPHAMVLGRAKVQDQAIVEDFAVVMDDAVLSGHARVNGQAVISKNTRLSGWQRAWFPLALDSEEEAPELTPRLGEELDPHGLWANYAMDQSEALILEDYYRQHAGGDFREFFCSVMNGYLYGSPEFKVEGERKGFFFDGKSQYAELNRRIADLAEITVDMTVKRLGDAPQTLLDFGSAEDNRFVLATDEAGRLLFSAVVDGKVLAQLVSSAPVERGAWTRVRLEIDGERIALWINDEPAGQTASPFRPASVYRAGLPQRNFIASARGGDRKFRGGIQNVVVYHKVHGEAFVELPKPFRDAPRRPEQGFARSVLREMGASPFEQSDRKTRMAEPIIHEWHSRAGRAITQLMELKLRVPEYHEAVAHAKEFEQWKKDVEGRLGADFDESEVAVAAKRQIEELESEIGAMRQEVEASPVADAAEAAPRVLELREELAGLQARLAVLKEVELAARAAVAAMPETQAAQAEITRLEQAMEPLGDLARTRLRELREAEDSDPELQAWKRAAMHLPYAKEQARVLRAYGEARGRIEPARRYMMRQELKTSDPEFRQWSDKNDRVASLRQEETYRLYDYLLRNTEHPRLLAQDRWNRGEISNAEEQIRNILRTIGEEERLAGRSEEQRIRQEASELLKGRVNEIRAELRNKRGDYVDRNMREAGFIEKQQEMNDRLDAATKLVADKYFLEYHALCSFIRQNFHGFYNERATAYIDRYSANAVGGVLLRDNLDTVERIENLFAPENWKTSVKQWDWRTQWEVDGSLEKLPLTQKWLERVRGATEMIPAQTL